ncbi:hypothetical protein WUBG_15337, partial [Wuchereria bancrofti]
MSQTDRKNHQNFDDYLSKNGRKNIACLGDIRRKESSHSTNPRLRKYATASTRLKSSHSFQDKKLLEESNGLIIVDER